MISVVIPTKNESFFLPELLASLKKQKILMQIIVADAFSTDGTVKIARRFGAKVVDGGMPSVGRNNGAKTAKGDILVFLDADVILPDGFLKKNIDEFKRRNLDFATTFVKPRSERLDDRWIHKLWNIVYLILARFSPFGCGFHIIVKKDIWDKTRFDASVVLGEDFDFTTRASKAGARFGVLRSVPILVSVRRLDKEGRLGFILKVIGAYIHTILKGPVRTDLFKYELGNHKPKA